MRRHRIFASIAIIVAILCSCQALPAYREIGVVDRTLVELLPSGKARTIDILGINDFHATLLEELTSVDGGTVVEGKNPGMAKLATALLEIRRFRPNSIFVSLGDAYQGSALSVLTKGKIVSEFYRMIGVAASAVGNHEFDWGDGYFSEWSEDGGFPFLAANIVDRATGTTPSWARPYIVVTIGGHRVAFLGLATLETLSTVSAAAIAGYEFKDPAESARYWVSRIRAIEKPEALIVLSHVPTAMDKVDPSRVIAASALGEIDRISAVGGIDAIMSGHSHVKVSGKSNGVPVVQGYYNGRGLGKISIAFKEDGGMSVSASFVDLYSGKASVAEDPAARAIYSRYMAEHGAALLEEVATVEGSLSHDRISNVTPMGYWVCETMRAAFGAQVAVMNGGGLRKGFMPGTARVQDFWDLMPFDNTAIVFTVKGSDLRRIIDHGIDSASFGNGQFSGIVVSYDPAGPYEGKIVSMTLADGTPVTDDGLYTVVTNDFIFENGGDGYVMMKPAATDVKPTFVLIRQALIDAAKASGAIVAARPEVLVPVTRP